jgi:SagB-type dehydrogenase family enzyme
MWSKRPSPSAGGIHPIDLVIYDSSRGPALYYYNPLDHSLNELDLNKDEIIDFVNHVYGSKVNSKKSTIIWMVAHPNRTNAKYQNSDSLVWRDAGCLLYCLNLVCNALKISFCSLGTLGEPYISRAFKCMGKFSVRVDA